MNSKEKTMTKEKIEHAHELISPFIHKTPILTNSYLDLLSEASLFFKCENFQKIGAFKMRGASYAIAKLNQAQKAKGVITHSSGNHAQAVALAAHKMNTKATIVMPKTAPKVKVAAVKDYGAKVVFCEANIQSRESAVKDIQDKEGQIFIPPFDHEDIITGQASCCKELIEESEDLDIIICPVGGGGLLAGTILSARYFSPKTVVYAAEPEGADDAFRSLKSGKREFNASTNTIADGLLTPLGKLNFEIILNGVKAIFTVDDLEIKSAMRLIWERMKIIVEPSCAVPLAAVLKYPAHFKNKKVGIILSGGNVDLNLFFNQL